MFATLKAATAGALLSLATVVTASAEAHDFHFRDHRPHVRFGVYFGDWPRYDFVPVHDRCTPEHALYKARRIGVHAPRIDFVSAHRIGVIGRSHGEFVSVTFGRAPGCPRFD
jgi:hypothetical protein